MSGTDICQRCDCPAFLSCLACYHNLKQDSSFIRLRCSNPAGAGCPWVEVCRVHADQWHIAIPVAVTYHEERHVEECECHSRWKLARKRHRFIFIQLLKCARSCIPLVLFISSHSWRAGVPAPKEVNTCLPVKCLKNATWMRQKQQYQ